MENGTKENRTMPSVPPRTLGLKWRGSPVKRLKARSKERSICCSHGASRALEVNCGALWHHFRQMDLLPFFLHFPNFPTSSPSLSLRPPWRLKLFLIGFIPRDVTYRTQSYAAITSLHQSHRLGDGDGSIWRVSHGIVDLPLRTCIISHLSWAIP